MEVVIDIEREAKTIKERTDDNNDMINYLIIVVEGLLPHISTLSKDKAKELLSQTKKTTAYIEDYRNLIYKLGGGSPEIEEKFNYLFKRLTNLHTNLHIIAYKDSPVLKTPKRFKEGLSNTSNESIAHSLFKEDGI